MFLRFKLWWAVALHIEEGEGGKAQMGGEEFRSILLSLKACNDDTALCCPLQVTDHLMLDLLHSQTLNWNAADLDVPHCCILPAITDICLLITSSWFWFLLCFWIICLDFIKALYLQSQYQYIRICTNISWLKSFLQAKITCKYSAPISICNKQFHVLSMYSYSCDC